MNLSEIRLSFAELHLLRSASKEETIRIHSNHRLVRLNLIDAETKVKTPGGMPVATGRGCISDLGKDFLAYHDDETWQFIKKSVLIPILVSFVTAFLTSRLITG